MARRSTFESIRRVLYKTQRTMGDVEAAEGGPARLGKRIVRRHVRRITGRYLGRWGL